MVGVERKAWSFVGKNPINSRRTDQYNSWKSIISRALPTTK